MYAIAEEDEKSFPSGWWPMGKKGGAIEEEVNIPLSTARGRDREKEKDKRRSLNLPRSPFAFPSDPSPSSFSRIFAPQSSGSSKAKSTRGATFNVASPLDPTVSDELEFNNESTEFSNPHFSSPSSNLKINNNNNNNTTNTYNNTNYKSKIISNDNKSEMESTASNSSTTTLDNHNSNKSSNSNNDEKLENNSSDKSINSNNSNVKISSFQRVPSRRSSEGDFAAQVLPKTAFLREMAEREIIESESAYVRDLTICIEEFYIPMKELLSKQDLDDIFINIEAIANIHTTLEKDLRDTSNIPGTFQKMTPFLRMYSNYCANGAKALETLIRCKKNPAVDKFLSQCMAKESLKGLPLDSYLIKPTQRLCKYPLLFQSLLSNTTSGTTEYKELEQVLNQIKEVVLVVNEKKRHVETIQIVEQLKSQIVDAVDTLFAKTTAFLKEGQLTVLLDPCETLSFYLFDDLLLATKPKGKKHRKQLVYAFGLDRMLVKDVVKLDESVPKTTFNLWTYQNEKKINLRLVAALEREKKSWISALDKAISAKGALMHEMFCKLSFESTKIDAKQLSIKSNSFDTWFLQRKIRLFGEDVVLKYDQQIQTLIAVRERMSELAEKEQNRIDEEDAETDTIKQQEILKKYKSDQFKKMEYINQLLLKLATLESTKVNT